MWTSNGCPGSREGRGGGDMIIDGQRAADRAITAVLGYYKAFNAGDWDAMVAGLTEDVAHDVNQAQREVGRPPFRAFLATMARHYRERIDKLVVMASQDGRRAAAEYVVHGTYLTTAEGLPPARGQNYTLPGGAFFELDHGRICRVTNYYNLTDWLKQVVE